MQGPPKRHRSYSDVASMLVSAARRGDADEVALALRITLTDPNTGGGVGFTALIRVTPTMTDEGGFTALIAAAQEGHTPVVTLLLADQRVNPNTTDQIGNTALMVAAIRRHGPVLELLLADHRTIRTRPTEDAAPTARAAYDAALFNVKYPRHARFKGLVRAMVAFRRMRLRAAQAVYAPGGAGFAAAAAHFNAAAAAL